MATEVKLKTGTQQPTPPPLHTGQDKQNGNGQGKDERQPLSPALGVAASAVKVAKENPAPGTREPARGAAPRATPSQPPSSANGSRPAPSPVGPAARPATPGPAARRAAISRRDRRAAINRRGRRARPDSPFAGTAPDPHPRPRLAARRHRARDRARYRHPPARRSGATPCQADLARVNRGRPRGRTGPAARREAVPGAAEARTRVIRARGWPHHRSWLPHP